jgi:hypothetical protein
VEGGDASPVDIALARKRIQHLRLARRGGEHHPHNILPGEAIAQHGGDVRRRSPAHRIPRL